MQKKQSKSIQPHRQQSDLSGKLGPMRTRSIILLFALLALTGCQLFSKPAQPSNEPLIQTMIAGTLTAMAPGQPATPVQAETPTPTYTPTEALPDGGVPARAEAIPLPAGTQTFLLMGSDQRPDAGDFRTDTMVLVVIKSDGSVTLVSFPRDLWVNLPEKGMQRLNAAQEFGGFELTQATFEYNFGFTPQSYVLTNFSGFKSIIDSLGGIDVQVAQSLHDTRTGYPDGFTVDPGTVHMDGEMALWYVRARKTTSDLDRLRRSQEVLFAIGRKLFTLNGLTRVPEFYAAFRGAVVTDLTLGDVTALLPLLKAVDSNKVQRYAIGADDVTPYITGEGADVLLPKPQAIRQKLLQALGN